MKLTKIWARFNGYDAEYYTATPNGKCHKCEKLRLQVRLRNDLEKWVEKVSNHSKK